MKTVSILIILFFTTLSFADRDNDDTHRYSIKFYGSVIKLPDNGLSGVWIINKREVHVTKKTKIQEEYGKVRVGAYVEVNGDYDNNIFTAYKIEVE